MDQEQSRVDQEGLPAQPFSATADPAYFYATRGAQQCLFQLWNTCDQRQGLAVVLGDYGSGKTTLLRKVQAEMESRRDRYRAAVLSAPMSFWTTFGLLEALAGQFGLRPENRSYLAYMKALNDRLRGELDVIHTLLIDDAQNLTRPGHLELLRLLGNLETPRYKLLNILCFAHESWGDVLRATPGFAQRADVVCMLPALELEDTRALIEFRLRQAGIAAPADQFESEAIRLIHDYSRGNPRLAVTLCRNAWHVARVLKAPRVSAELVGHTAEKLTLLGSEAAPRATGPSQSLPAASVPEQPRALPPRFPLATEERRRLQETRANELLLRVARERAERAEGSEPHGPRP